MLERAIWTLFIQSTDIFLKLDRSQVMSTLKFYESHIEGEHFQTHDNVSRIHQRIQKDASQHDSLGHSRQSSRFSRTQTIKFRVGNNSEIKSGLQVLIQEKTIKKPDMNLAYFWSLPQFNSSKRLLSTFAICLIFLIIDIPMFIVKSNYSSFLQKSMVSLTELEYTKTSLLFSYGLLFQKYHLQLKNESTLWTLDDQMMLGESISALKRIASGQDQTILSLEKGRAEFCHLLGMNGFQGNDLQYCHDMLSPRTQLNHFQVLQLVSLKMEIIANEIGYTDGFRLTELLAAHELNSVNWLVTHLHLAISPLQEDLSSKVTARIAQFKALNWIYNPLYLLVVVLSILLYMLVRTRNQTAAFRKIRLSFLLLNSPLLNNSYLKGLVHRGYSIL